MFTSLIAWILVVTKGLGYTGVTILMAIESSFIPLPSELVIPPAAWLASEGQLNIFLVIFYGTLGSIIAVSYTHLTLPTNREV